MGGATEEGGIRGMINSTFSEECLSLPPNLACNGAVRQGKSREVIGGAENTHISHSG